MPAPAAGVNRAQGSLLPALRNHRDHHTGTTAARCTM